jgi:hypothetical protein
LVNVGAAAVLAGADGDHVDNYLVRFDLEDDPVSLSRRADAPVADQAPDQRLDSDTGSSSRSKRTR